MFKNIIMFICIICLFSTTVLSAQTVKNEINLDNLSPQEKTLFFELQKKSQFNKNTSTAEELAKGIKDLKGIDVKSLTDWRVFITETIKDICKDLNVSVNEFIKTPAGAGIAGLIIYKVAGKDILFTVVSKIFDVIFIIPFWILIVTFILFFWRKYFKPVLVYEKVVEKRDDAGKIIEIISKRPKRKTAYPFQTSDARSFMAAALIGSFVIVNFITLMVLFVK